MRLGSVAAWIAVVDGFQSHNPIPPTPRPPDPPTPRFNLLREESEGYAKLATLLNQQGPGRLTADAVAPVVRRRPAPLPRPTLVVSSGPLNIFLSPLPKFCLRALTLILIPLPSHPAPAIYPPPSWRR